jgi:hypothetical protein
MAGTVKSRMHSQKNKHHTTPQWLNDARAHATDYLHRFAFNPGVEKIVAQFDKHYAHIKDPNTRLDHLKKLAAEQWDFRKGRERYEITETYEMDEPNSALGKYIFEGAAQAEMGVSSRATLKHYSIMAVLGGANKSPYMRLKYGLEQKITYDMLAYLGSERELPPAEREAVAGYASGARTEFDLGKGAIRSLVGKELAGRGEYELYTAEWHIVHLQRKDGLPIFLLSAPPFLGGRRANTADTYDFMCRLEQEAFNPTKNILFTTGALYRYAQYFDAMREIHLRTGVDIEVIAYEPVYGGMEFKPTQFLQELKAAADAAVRLRDAVKGKEERHDWRASYYNRFERNEADRPVDKTKVN